MTDNGGDRFNRLHDAIWSAFSVAGFPLKYREHINDLQRQASLVVMTTMEDIDLLRQKAEAEDFNPDEQLENFCKSMYALTGHGEPGSVQNVMAKIAENETLGVEDMQHVEAIRESLARSQMKEESNIDGPISQPWKRK